MTVSGAMLLLIAPADWEVVPAAVTELRRCLAEEYRASLMLRWATAPLSSPLVQDCGSWERDMLPRNRPPARPGSPLR